MSREHCISEGVLLRVFGGPTGQLAGMPWLKGQVKRLSTSSFTGRFLCEGHNNGMSSLDSLALRFVSAIQDGSSEIRRGAKRSVAHTFNGKKLERWLLKTIFGLNETGSIGASGVAYPYEAPDVWKRLITSDQEWPEGWGLYMPLSHKAISLNSYDLSVLPLSHDERGIMAAHFTLAGIRLSLLLGKPDHQDAWGQYRPQHLQLSNRDAVWTLRLRWDEQIHGEGVHYQHLFGGY